MIQKVAASEAKTKFSDLLSRVFYSHDRFLIERKGKPIAALVAIEDLKRLESTVKPSPRGLLATIGAWKKFKNLDRVIKGIYKAREKALDRSVRLG